MAVVRRHTISGVKLGATVLSGITRETISLNSEVRGEPTSGEVFPRYLSLTKQNPTGMFASQHIASALTLLGSIGLDIADLSGGLILYAAAHERGSTRKTGANHRSYTINDGLVIPTRLTCDYQGDAELEVQVLVTYDGTNNPVVITDSVALPTVTDNERYSLGPISVGGVDLPQLRRVELDFGLRAQAIGAGGGSAPADVWPTFASISQGQPTLTCRGIDVEWFKAANVPIGGLAVTHATTAIYFRKRLRHSTFVADATEEHVLITADGMAVIDDAISASGDAEAESSVIIPLDYDGTNAPLVIDTTAAIT